MSQSESTQSNGDAQNTNREVARRVFATELDDATYTFKEEDREQAPNYALLPTGEKANRVFVVGTLTEVNDVGEDSEYLQGRIVGPSGTFFVYAGPQYQPEPAAFLRDVVTPKYVSVTAKPQTYDTDDGDTNVSLRPESITEVDEATRNRWVVETADQTADRIKADAPSDHYNQLVNQKYDEVDLSVYQTAAIEAVESVTGSGGEDTKPEAEPAEQ